MIDPHAAAACYRIGLAAGRGAISLDDLEMLRKAIATEGYGTSGLRPGGQRFLEWGMGNWFEAVLQLEQEGVCLDDPQRRGRNE